jgi:hypothetical protein
LGLISDHLPVVAVRGDFLALQQTRAWRAKQGGACSVTSKERLGDRRAEVRFEIIGNLWATLVATQSLPVVNVGPGGMLVESTSPLIVGSSQRLRLNIDDRPREVNATVRHVTSVHGRPDRYLVGLAFVDLPIEARNWIESIVGGRQFMAGTGGEA